MIHKLNRRLVFCIKSAFARVMLCNAAVNIRGYAGIKRFIATSDYIEEPRHRIKQHLRIIDCIITFLFPLTREFTAGWEKNLKASELILPGTMGLLTMGLFLISTGGLTPYFDKLFMGDFRVF